MRVTSSLPCKNDGRNFASLPTNALSSQARLEATRSQTTASFELRMVEGLAPKSMLSKYTGISPGNLAERPLII